MHQRGFTLIELLITVAIIAILSTVVILALNPAQLLKQSRDSNRLLDLNTLGTAISALLVDQPLLSLGSVSTTYISIPDSATTCLNLGLPALPAGYSYRCATSSLLQSPAGSGWLPTDMTAATFNSPLSQLPVDPLNATSSGFYYSYTTNGSSQWQVVGLPESQKQRLAANVNAVVANAPGIYSQGNNLALSALYSSAGLAGYWKLDEGSGSGVGDASGNGASGAWTGTQAGQNGTYYTGGKVGAYAGFFNGTDDYVSVSTANFSMPYAATGFSIALWANITDNGGYRTMLSKVAANIPGPFDLYLANSTDLVSFLVGNGTVHATLQTGSVAIMGTWQHWAFVYDGTNMSIYLNGLRVAGPTAAGVEVADTNNSLRIGRRADGGTIMKGALDDVRIYSRALSAAEIQALYNAGR